MPNEVCYLVVVRVSVTTTHVSIKKSQPCGKCRDVLVTATLPNVRCVVWSTDDGFAACAPADVPQNAYRALNGQRRR